MATHVADDITYVLILDARHADYLGTVRHWDNLRTATDGEQLYVRDFTQAQFDSVEIKSIPYKKLYYLHGHKLFPYGSTLPSHRMPSSLLWSPMDRVLTVERPHFNPNYFGLGQEVSVQLVPTDEERQAAALWVTRKALGEYLVAAPTLRVKPLQWIIVGQHALVLGTPLLPLQGDVLWAEGDFLVPAGYGFDLPLLVPALNKRLNPQGDFWVFWDVRSRYTLLHKSKFRPLTLGSFRLSESLSSTQADTHGL